MSQLDRTQIAKHGHQLLVGFAQTEHQAGLGPQLRADLFDALQDAQRAFVFGAGPDFLIQPGHRFGVVVVDVQGEPRQRW